MTEHSDQFSFCVNHPRVPTLLRCNKCSRPVCARCLVLTPVGYRCRDCIRGQQQRFIDAPVSGDYARALIGAAVVAALGSVGFVLQFFVACFAPVIALIAGGLVLAVLRRQGPGLTGALITGFVIGSLVGGLGPLGLFVLNSGGLIDGFLALIINEGWIVLYALSGAAALYVWLRYRFS